MPGGNLGQIEHSSARAFMAAARTASSAAQSSLMMHAASPAIARALQGSGLSPYELRLAYTQSLSDRPRLWHSHINAANTWGARAAVMPPLLTHLGASKRLRKNAAFSFQHRRMLELLA